MTMAAAARRAARSSLAERTRRAAEVTAGLHRLYPDAECALTHGSAWELLAATILSAQCTDERVNKVTPVLFSRFPTVADMARAHPAAIEEIIRSTGFFRAKARSLHEAACVIVSRHAGEVPSAMEDLTALPGVGRKTAHVVRGTWFALPAIFVDTHVGRLSRRLGFTRHEDPVKVESDLAAILPADEQTFTCHALIWHGRRVCAARRPRCGECALAPLCPSAPGA
jgi:endonuclease-3